MLYVGYAEDAPGNDEKRAAMRDQHVAYLRAKPDVVVLGGGLLDGADARVGTCLIISAPDMAAAQAWFANEPYNKAGFFKSIKITRVSRGVWNPDLAADTK
jgi:uncharacterized protein YciI